MGTQHSNFHEFTSESRDSLEFVYGKNLYRLHSLTRTDKSAWPYRPLLSSTCYQSRHQATSHQGQMTLISWRQELHPCLTSTCHSCSNIYARQFIQLHVSLCPNPFQRRSDRFLCLHLFFIWNSRTFYGIRPLPHVLHYFYRVAYWAFIKHRILSQPC